MLDSSGFMKGSVTASIIIPTYNGEEYLEEVLRAVFNQDVDFKYEVNIIDSGSVDKTLAIAKKFPVRIIEIPNKEFGHGKTRNLGAEGAEGEYLIYLSHDATPSHSGWLKEMIRSFSLYDDVGNVVGKQIPRANCNPVIKRDMEETFKKIGGGNDELTVYFIKDGEEGRKEYIEKKELMRFNSDVNAAYLKRAWEKIKFRDVEYAEDQIMGQDMLEGGFRRVYNPGASVNHSHQYNLQDFLKRYFDEYRGLHVVFGFVDENATLQKIIPDTLRRWFADTQYIFQRGDYDFIGKMHWSAFGLCLNFFRKVGAYLGARHEKLPLWSKKLLSLEESRKHKINSSEM